MSLLRKIARFLWRITIKIQEILLVLSSTFLALSICAMAFLRYVFQTDLFGLEEILLLLGMWLYFIGGAYGSFEKSQIKANVIEMLIKNKRILAVCDLAQSFLSTGLFLIASLYCIDFLDFSIMAGSKTPVFKIPYYVGHSAVAVGFILMFFYSLVYLLQDIGQKWAFFAPKTHQHPREVTEAWK